MTLPRISAPVICWWSASAITMPTAQRPSAMSRRMPSARACAPSGTLPAATARCASLPPPWRCASLTRPVSATPRLPPTARRCAPLPPRSARRLSTLVPLPPPPTPPLALSAARPAICGWAQSRTNAHQQRRRLPHGTGLCAAAFAGYHPGTGCAAGEFQINFDKKKVCL